MNMPRVALLNNSKLRKGHGLKLQTELGIPSFHDHPLEKFDFILELTDTQLQLRRQIEGKPSVGPVFCDFNKSSLDFRRRYSKGKQDLLRAIGGNNKKVLDTTAGLGTDALVMAFHGCRVTAVEKSPIVFSLLRDALQNDSLPPDLKEILGKRLEVINSDSIDFMKANKGKKKWDVAYLDPMFFVKSKTALPKKEMAVLHDLLDRPSEEEIRELIRQCRTVSHRTVIKRPLRSTCTEKPSFSIEGNLIRFDVYV